MRGDISRGQLIQVSWYRESEVSEYFLACLDDVEISASGLMIGRSPVQTHPRLISQSQSSYQLNQLGSEAASDSTSTVDYLRGSKYSYFPHSSEPSVDCPLTIFLGGVGTVSIYFSEDTSS